MDNDYEEEILGSRRAPKACVECHRLKQKCDAFEQYPDPCTRCKRRLRTCTFSGGGSSSKGLTLLSTLSASSGSGHRVEKNQNQNHHSHHQHGRATSLHGSVGDVHRLRSPASSAGESPHSVGSGHVLSGNSGPSSGPGSASGPGTGPGAMSDTSAAPATPLSKREAPPSTTAPPASQAQSHPQTQQQSQAPPQQQPYDQPTYPTTLPCAVPTVHLHGQPVPKERVARLHKTFMTDFFPHFPIVPTMMLQEGSPLFYSTEALFLAMCMVAAAAVDREMVPAIRARIKPLIDAKTAYLSLSRAYEAQAIIFSLLILCNWPLATSRLQDEISFMYSGMALYSSLQLGLHHSALPHDLTFSDAHRDMRYSAWKAVTVICQLQCMIQGVPNTVPTMGYYNEAAMQSSNRAMSELCKQSEMLRFYSRAASVFASNPESEHGLAAPTMRTMLHREFIDSFAHLQVRLAPMSPLTQLMWHITQVVFHALMLLPETPSESMKLAVGYIVTNGIAYADVLRSHFADDSKKLMTLPAFVAMGCMHISAALYKIMSSSQLGHLVDEAKALEIISLFEQVMPALSRDFDPQIVPSAGIGVQGTHWMLSALHGFKVLYRERRFNDKVASIRTRMGASVMMTAVVELIKEGRRRGEVVIEPDQVVCQQGPGSGAAGSGAGAGGGMGGFQGRSGSVSGSVPRLIRRGSINGANGANGANGVNASNGINGAGNPDVQPANNATSTTGNNGPSMVQNVFTNDPGFAGIQAFSHDAAFTLSLDDFDLFQWGTWGLTADVDLSPH